jgi:hypothetical protein
MNDLAGESFRQEQGQTAVVAMKRRIFAAAADISPARRPVAQM